MGDANSIGCYGGNCRNSPTEVFLDKGAMKILSKFIGEHPMLKCEFNNAATLLKSNFHMGVFLSICCIFLGHCFLRTPLEGSSCSWSCYSYVLSLFTSLSVLISFFVSELSFSEFSIF